MKVKKHNERVVMVIIIVVYVVQVENSVENKEFNWS